MEFNEKELTVTDDDLKKIFALFTSCTGYEKKQAFDESSQHYFKQTDLSEEYELTEEKRELALDAWRAVLAFLQSEGYSLAKEDKRIDLSFIEREFIQ